jgi:hypothetical protein
MLLKKTIAAEPSLKTSYRAFKCALIIIQAIKKRDIRLDSLYGMASHKEHMYELHSISEELFEKTILNVFHFMRKKNRLRYFHIIPKELITEKIALKAIKSFDPERILPRLPDHAIGHNILFASYKKSFPQTALGLQRRAALLKEFAKEPDPYVQKIIQKLTE